MSDNTARKYPGEKSQARKLIAMARDCRPFLKWAGGKSQLLQELCSRLPERYGRYFEPFVGGGALLFQLKPKTAYISDVNDELINVYLVIRDNVEELIRELRKHRYEKDYFYAVRNWDRSASHSRLSKVRRAGRLIYLNKTCFNGLYRVNSKGHFNVPFGDYVDPKICDPANLRACSKALAKATIKTDTYLGLEAHVKKGDFIYFDPPYLPLSATSNFTNYSRDGFTAEDQVRLSEFCKELDRRGVLFMLSNSSAPLIQELYDGFNLQFVHAARAINSKATHRGKIKEVVVTNY